MGQVNIPIVGPAYNMPETQLDSQRCINWYISMDKTGKFPSALIPRIMAMYQQEHKKYINYTENLEQIEWLEKGIKMHSISSYKTHSIDTPEDYESFQRYYFSR